MEFEAEKKKAERLNEDNLALVHIIEVERAGWATAEQEFLKRLEVRELQLTMHHKFILFYFLFFGTTV